MAYAASVSSVAITLIAERTNKHKVLLVMVPGQYAASTGKRTNGIPVRQAEVL
jgi:hypothetical protein